MSSLPDASKNYRKSLREFRNHAQKFLYAIKANSEQRDQSMNFEFYKDRYISKSKMFTQCQQLVTFHNQHVSILSEYLKHFFKINNKVEKLGLEFSIDAIKLNDLFEYSMFIDNAIIFTDDLNSSEDKVVTKYNVFATGINDIDINLNKGVKPDIKELTTLGDQINDIHLSFFNSVVFHRNETLKFLKLVFPNKFRFIESSNFIIRLEDDDDQKED